MAPPGPTDFLSDSGEGTPWLESLGYIADSMGLRPTSATDHGDVISPQSSEFYKI